MEERIEALSDRERETLRLLLGGHDAKSIARNLDLSVHTVNERLREARRKLGVSSSREAARLLAEAERRGPNSLADKQFGVTDAAIGVTGSGQPERRWSAGQSFAWLGGGMLIMSLLIAAFALSSAYSGSNETLAPAAPIRVATAASPVVSGSLSAPSALEWVALLDGQRWEESWDAAGAILKSQMPKERWQPTVQPVREMFGPVSSRVLHSVSKPTSLPGAPTGEYELLEFETNFAKKQGAIETVVLAREGSGWKVDGYFIR